MIGFTGDVHSHFFYFFFFFNDTATTEIYTLSLHDALPICRPRIPPSPRRCNCPHACPRSLSPCRSGSPNSPSRGARSEEHTSELQSRQYLVCRLLLEKKKKTDKNSTRV